MLGRYLKEQPFFHKGATACRHLAGNAHDKEKHAVEQLEKDMDHATDPAMLAKAREAQQGMLIQSTIQSYQIDAVVDFEAGRGELKG